MLSVVLPSYNEEKMIPIAAERLGKILTDAKIDYELLFVDDGSRDRTWEEIRRCAKEDRHVVGVQTAPEEALHQLVKEDRVVPRGGQLAVQALRLRPDTLPPVRIPDPVLTGLLYNLINHLYLPRTFLLKLAA